MAIDNEYIGQVLLKRGFKDWFMAMFKLTQNRPFIIEPIHGDLFQAYRDVYNGEIKRINLNLPPRGGKTELAKYFVVYGMTWNPRSNFIYTSFSQSLLNSISEGIKNIMEHPAYIKMYPQKIRIEESETKPVNEFWERIGKNDKEGANIYTNRKIVTAHGGSILFNSIGGMITGFGAGIRNANGFSGALIMDDFQKPADIRSELYRKKSLVYYEETLLSRLNNPNVPIVNIQQRLHIEDISGILKEKYKFKVVKKPLIDSNGECQIPTQYNEERLKEIQTNAYMFSAQYQQEPIILGGEVIKREWFRYYDVNVKYNYKRVFITADTAMEVKKHNDFSCFIVWGVTQDNRLHVLDISHGKWEAPELEKEAVNMWNKWKKDPDNGITCNGLYIEKKASGIGLLQGLRTKYGIPVLPLEADRDKLSRVESVLSYIQSGMVMLPSSDTYGDNPKILNECESFTRDDSHAHDDIVDTIAYGIKEGLSKNKVSLLDYFN